MSGTTVWTASVWGGAKSSALPPSGKLKDGEEECMICRGDVPASVGFRPCGHTVCFSCVENMRAKNIFKADKGVRCPFCRTFIEQYETLKSSNNARAQELLQEANRAAAIAAAARSPAPPPQQAPPLVPTVREPENWTCPSCNNSNLHWRTECNRCHKPDPRGAKPAVRAKDVLKCTDDEIVLYVNEKLHPHLNKAFLEAGTPYCQGRVTGTQEQIIGALKNKGEERLLRVVKALVDSGKLQSCVVHFFGNYTIQDLLEATGKLRTATEASYQFMWDSFKAANQGLDPFGLLHRGMLPLSADCASHPQGTYVVQKVVELGTCWEVLQMTQRLVSIGPTLTADPRGIHVVAKCLQQLVALTSGMEVHPDIAEVADSLCLGFYKMPDKMKYAAHHGLGAKILADAIQLGLPKFGALKLATRLCSRAQDYASSNSGLSIVIALLSIQPMAPGSAELVRDLVCLMAWSLQGRLKDYVMMQDDPRGPFLVEYCIKRLAEEQEIAWIDAVIQELVGAGDVLATCETAMEVLKMALSLSVYDTESVEMHLQQLEELVGPDLGAEIENDVFARINRNGPPPAPKYFAPSYIQPDLKYHVVSGVRLAPVPRPPRVKTGTHSHRRRSNGVRSDDHIQSYGATNEATNGWSDTQLIEEPPQGWYGTESSGYSPGPTYEIPTPQSLYDVPVPQELQVDGTAGQTDGYASPQSLNDETTNSPNSSVSITDLLVPKFGNLTPEDTAEPQEQPQSGSITFSSHISNTTMYRPPPAYPLQNVHPPIPQPVPSTPTPIPHPIPSSFDTPYSPPPPYSLSPHSNSHYYPLPMGLPHMPHMPPQYNPTPYAPPLYGAPQPYMPIGPRPMQNEPPVQRPVPIPLPVPVPPIPSSQPPAVVQKEPSYVTHVVTPSKSQRSAVPKPVPVPVALPIEAPVVAIAKSDLPSTPKPPVAPSPMPALASAAACVRQAAPSGPSWQCKVCTYEHTNSEAEFLVCAVCGTEKGAGTYKS